MYSGFYIAGTELYGADLIKNGARDCFYVLRPIIMHYPGTAPYFARWAQKVLMPICDSEVVKMVRQLLSASKEGEAEKVRLRYLGHQ